MYNKVLDQIGSKINMVYFSKDKLDNSMLIESAEKFEKNEFTP